MYNKGLIFPIFHFFFFDNIAVSNSEDIKKLKINHDYITPEKLKSNILDVINTNKGYEILPFLLNSFDYFLGTKNNFKSNEIGSEFVKDKINLAFYLNNYFVDFEKIDSALKDLEEISNIDKKSFYNKIHLLLFKNYFIKISKYINFSDEPSVTLFFNFENDFKNFIDYSKEIDENKPHVIKQYDYKIKYVAEFRKSFKTDNVDDIISKIENIKQYTESNIKKTLKNIFIDTCKIKSSTSANKRNKFFRPIYLEIMPKINGRLYNESAKSQNALTKEIKTFFS